MTYFVRIIFDFIINLYSFKVRKKDKISFSNETIFNSIYYVLFYPYIIELAHIIKKMKFLGGI